MWWIGASNHWCVGNCITRNARSAKYVCIKIYILISSFYLTFYTTCSTTYWQSVYKKEEKLLKTCTRTRTPKSFDTIRKYQACYRQSNTKAARNCTKILHRGFHFSQAVEPRRQKPELCYRAVNWPRGCSPLCMTRREPGALVRWSLISLAFSRDGRNLFSASSIAVLRP